MIFSTPIFLFFFFVFTTGLYFFTGRKNIILLFMSIIFYSWGEAEFVVLLLISALLNYVFGILIENYRGKKQCKIFLCIAVSMNLLGLIVFKYTNFLVENINIILEYYYLSHINIDSVHLPLGVSFFTFQAISYVVDVYRRDASVQRNFLNLALYISMFPQLIAGPIVRYNQIEKALHDRTVDRHLFALGVQQFIIGLAKKTIIADTLAVSVDQIFALPVGDLSSELAWFGALCFGLQIYFDFSGYSDMAIGMGRMFGFRFPDNFNYPYISQSIREFWRRWHITLSTWFRDYLYIPLGGNRGGEGRTLVNLLVVFVCTGFWHGASWNFLVWGLIHGVFLVIERIPVCGRLLDAAPAFIRHGYVLVVVMVSWVVFRTDSLDAALQFLGAMAGTNGWSNEVHVLGRYTDPYIWTIFVLGMVFSTPLVRILRRITWAAARGKVIFLGRNTLAGIRVAAMISLLWFSISVVATGTHQAFIYFRF